MRHLTIYTSPAEYGDGIDEAEALALACAERDAVRRRWPDACVTLQNATGCRPATDDPEIVEWVGQVWDRILSTEGNGAYVPSVVEKWGRE
jgi:hypothetical protein